ncbi:hypothetical protein MASR1M45_09520 [Candidatus Kapaibacterium sp.]
MSVLKNIIPSRLKSTLKSLHKRYSHYQLSKNPKLTIEDIEKIVIDELGIKNGDTVFIHSSVDKLNLTCSPFDLLNLLLSTVGKTGNILFPTYPAGYSYNFVSSGKVFNQKSTPSSTGILSEIARRHKNAVRSLHPTKSVVAIGNNAAELTDSHHTSPYPYDSVSPYFKIYQFKPKIIGLGIKTTYLSCVHTVDDTYKENFPVEVYHQNVFHSECIKSNGDKVFVDTYAHDMKKMIFDLPTYFKTYIPKHICTDLKISGYDFFKADGLALYNEMINLYENHNITIYPKRIYRSK